MNKWSSARIRPRIPVAPIYKPCLECRRYMATKKEPHMLRQLREMREHDEKDGKFRIDSEKKVVLTDVGNLPMSPVMDPAWADAVGRPKASKPRPSGKPVGRFRKLLSQNIYALALSTDIRVCQSTDTFLPKHFLQPFGLIRHPETKEPWWTPAGLVDTSPDPAAAASVAAEAVTADEAVVKKGGRTGLCYTLANKSVIGRYQRQLDRAGFSRKLVAKSKVFVSEVDKRTTVWREGMEVAVLDLMRRDVVNNLANLAKKCEEMGRDWLSPMTDFNEIKGYKTRGCILWRPVGLDMDADVVDAVAQRSSLAEDNAQEAIVEDHAAGGRPSKTPQTYATFDVPDAQYFRKMPVYDLELLLGKPQLLRLIGASPTFREHPVVLMAYMRCQKLQLKLWKLQGYLARDEMGLETSQHQGHNPPGGIRRSRRDIRRSLDPTTSQMGK